MTDKDYKEMAHAVAVLSSAIIINNKDGKKDEVEKLAHTINRAANSILILYEAKSELETAIKIYKNGK